MTYFVPMRYKERLDKDGKPRRYLAPVVSNLLFLKKSAEQQQLGTFLADNGLKVQVIRKERGSAEWCEIPASEMRELIYVCDPDKVLYELITAEEAAMKPGAAVQVTHGPLKGFTGKLVRHSHQYYLLRAYTGLAVMVKVTKWCCKPLSDDKTSGGR